VGDYARARELVTPDSYDLAEYNEPGYVASDNDFKFTAVNVNTVFRWEYRPGSTIFLVWTHARETFDQRAHHSDRTAFQNRLSSDALFSNEPENVLMAKVNYWFSL
jgi:hypothetical protein